MGNPNYPPPAPHTGNVAVDDLPHLTTVSCFHTAFMLFLLTVDFLKGLAELEHRGDQTHDGRHHIPVGPGPPRLEYYAPMAVRVPLPLPRVHVPV